MQCARLYRWGFLTPPVEGALFLAALVASCFLGAFPPVDLRAVCLVRAMAKKKKAIKTTLSKSDATSGAKKSQVTIMSHLLVRQTKTNLYLARVNKHALIHPNSAAGQKLCRRQNGGCPLYGGFFLRPIITSLTPNPTTYTHCERISV